MKYGALWSQARSEEIVPLSQFDSSIQECLLQGDQVFDHYGGKPSFLILEYHKTRLLTLELQEDRASVRIRSVVNATGGYGTGLLGGDIGILSTVLQEGLLEAACTNDEWASIERFHLTKKMRNMVAEHTKTQAEDWAITFTSTGTEAIDFAMQLVQLEGFNLGTGVDSRASRDVMIACHGAWHGWGLNPNQLLDRKQFTDGIPRFLQNKIVFHQYGNIAQLEELFQTYAGRIRAIFVEGILGDGGVIKGPLQWWERLFELASAEDARVVDDEILTGLRSGGLLALPKGKAPDCITLGKGLGFGLFPLSAVAWKKGRLNPRPGIGVRTFNARPLHCRVVLEGLEYIEKNNLFERSAQLGALFLKELSVLPHAFPEVYKAVRGQGLIFGVELANPLRRKGRLVRNSLVRQGVLTEIESGQMGLHLPKDSRINETIRLTPPLTFPEEEISTVIRSFYEAGKTLCKDV